MKLASVIILLFTTQNVLCQVVYTSPITEYFPHYNVEYINRTISINAETIIVESETPIKTIKKQIFYIREYMQEELPQQGLSDVFVCSTKDGLYNTYFLIPVMDKVEYIEVAQPRQLNLEPKGYRFLLD